MLISNFNQIQPVIEILTTFAEMIGRGKFFLQGIQAEPVSFIDIHGVGFSQRPVMIRSICWHWRWHRFLHLLEITTAHHAASGRRERSRGCWLRRHLRRHRGRRRRRRLRRGKVIRRDMALGADRHQRRRRQFGGFQDRRRRRRGRRSR